MFNIETLLSVFNKKGTLLKWLQQLEEALKGDTLKGVEISQVTADQIQMNFLFKDGTNLLSDIIDLPIGPQGVPGKDGTNGEPGKDGRGIVTLASGAPTEEDGYTVTPVTTVYSDGTSPSSFKVRAKNGTNGNGIVNIETVGYEPGTGEFEGYTKTNLNLDTDDEVIPFGVYAKNGSTVQNPLYSHSLKLIRSNGNGNIYINLINTYSDPITASNIRLQMRGLLLPATGIYNKLTGQLAVKIRSYNVPGTVGDIIETTFLTLKDNVMAAPSLEPIQMEEETDIVSVHTFTYLDSVYMIN